MSITIHKQTYSGGRAYRYRILDEAGQLCCVGEPTGLLLPTPTRLVEFFDLNHDRVGRLQPSSVASWRRARCYEVLREGVEEPYAVIRECLRLADLLLLRLPRYEVRLGRTCFGARGSRYGDRFYEIFLLRRGEGKVDEQLRQGAKTGASGKRASGHREVKVGQIERPTSGPSYVVETDAAPLRQALTVLAALVILIDMDLYPR